MSFTISTKIICVNGLVVFFAFITLAAFGQARAIPDIEKALAENQLAVADALVEKQINYYYGKGVPDSLNNYIFYVGKIAELTKNADYAVKQVELFINKIKTLTSKPSILRQMYIEA
ncbi:MAG TPA: hypothetical protein VF623_05125, partial [Segetibacter sp.]